MDAEKMADSLFATVRKYLDGRLDAMLTQVRSLVGEAVNALPPPEPGKPGADGKDGRDAPTLEEVLRSIPAPKDGRDGKDGLPGADGVAPSLDEIVRTVLPMLPVAKDGRDGRDGPTVAEVLASMPPAPRGEKGDRGEAGEPGKPGRDGADGLHGKDGAPGKDGRDGLDGAAGKDGAPGQDGRDGADGREGPRGQDGKSVTVEEIKAVVEQYRAVWELEFERRAMVMLQRAIDAIPLPRDGRDGKDGAPGRDGAELEDFDLELAEDGRTFTFSARVGPQLVRRSVVVPVPIDVGTYRAGMKAMRGDVVTYAGNLWIARSDTEEKPGPGAEWRLAVRRGKDGRDVQREPAGEVVE